MIAVLIHAHKNSNQIKRLVHVLQHPEIKVFLHIDKKSRLEINYPGVTVINNPVSVDWASFSQLKALLNSLEQIRGDQIKYDFVHFISGQDFPIKPVKDFVEFLNGKKGYSFVEAKNILNEWPRAAIRYQRFYFSENSLLNYLARPFSKLLFKLYKRKPPMEIYGGSQWVTLSSSAVDYILNRGNKQSKFYRFMKYCNVSDELFVQTLLYNSPLKEQCINDNLRLISWNNAAKGLTDSPDVLTINDYDKIKSSAQFFARKFDEQTDGQILDKITIELLK